LRQRSLPLEDLRDVRSRVARIQRA
jgi:hypothetical protein